MIRRAFSIAAPTLLLCFSAGGVLGTTAKVVTTPTTTTVCQEDEACWDWRTMGNHERGICVGDTWMIQTADGTIHDRHPRTDTCTEG